MQLISGYRSAKVLFTAVSLDLFSVTHRKWRSTGYIAKELGLDNRACGVFVRALAGLGFLRKKGLFYSNARAANKYLIPHSAKSIFHNLRYQTAVWNGWTDLSSVLVRGGPRTSLKERLRDPVFTNDYIAGMKEIARVTAPEVAKHLEVSSCKSMLDVGGGPGDYTVEIIKKNPSMKATILDLPQTLAVTEKLLGRNSARIDKLPGDYRTDSFGNERFDLILLSHITHDEGRDDNRAIFKKAFTALRPSGRIAVHDFMLKKDECLPVFGALFSVHMLTYTNKGQTYSEFDYRRWLSSAGFRSIQRREICKGAIHQTILLTAKK